MASGTNTFSTNLHTAVAQGSPKFVLFLTLELRLVYSAFAALLVPHLALNPALIRGCFFSDTALQPSAGYRYYLWGVWQRMDTLHYTHIAMSGYDYPQGVVFPPLYPILIRITSLLIPEPTVAALIISTGATFFLFWGLQKLLLLDYPPDVVLRTILLVGVWPATVIYFGAYPDSLLMALVIWSIYFTRLQKWWAATLLAVFAGMAKAIGLAVVVPIAILAWRAKAVRAWPLALSPLGFAGYLGYLHFTGRLLPSDAYQMFWSTRTAPPWTTIAYAVQQVREYSDLPFRLSFGLLLLALVCTFLRRCRFEYFSFAVAALIIILTKCSHIVQQQWGRYVLVLIPMYLNLALTLTREWHWAVVVTVFSAINLLLLYGFLEWRLMM